MEKLLITQALDEREMLRKKIHDKINKARFLDTICVNSEKADISKETRIEFENNAKAAYQQIDDLMARFWRLNRAIIRSNANTILKTSQGDLSVAEVISMRDELKSIEPYNFRASLISKMEEEEASRRIEVSIANKSLAEKAESMRLAILGKDSNKKEDKPLEVVNEFIKQNTTELLDPLSINKKIEEFKDFNSRILREFDSAIKVSNATTYIEF